MHGNLKNPQKRGSCKKIRANRNCSKSRTQYKKWEYLITRILVLFMETVQCTWINFLVARDAVRVNDALEYTRELVGPVECWRDLLSRHSIENRRHTTTAVLLETTTTRSHGYIDKVYV